MADAQPNRRAIANRRRTVPLGVRLLRRMDVDPDTGCWRFTGTHISRGYAMIWAWDRMRLVHRVSYELFVGPITDDQWVEHANGCIHADCFHPDHLEVITPQERADREQWGPKNARWLGEAACYSALHNRVERARGKHSLCAWCGATEGRFEWANLSGNYSDVSDYERLCVFCHRGYDAMRRRETGRRTMPI